MKHARAGKKLGRDSAHRKALYSNLAGALITHGRIQTTEAKAKAVKPFAEKMITLGKRGDLQRGERRSPSCARRTSCTTSSPRSLRALRSDPAVTRGSSSSASDYGDAAEMVYLELVDYEPGDRRDSPAPARRGLAQAVTAVTPGLAPSRYACSPSPTTSVRASGAPSRATRTRHAQRLATRAVGAPGGHESETY